MKRNPHTPLPVIGWREWVGLPELGIQQVKAKVDTGARSSSLHAFDIQQFERDGQIYVSFGVHPLQRDQRKTVRAEAPVLEFRPVRSSNGQASLRPVILTALQALSQQWTIELTLANRDAMGFRMLLGREGLRGRLLVDSGRSYYGGKPSLKQQRR